MNSNNQISTNRCVILLDENLPFGRAANATAVIALTIGQRHPYLVGDPLIDASGVNHPGLIPIGITVLSASYEDLNKVREDGINAGCDVIDFPLEGQLTKDYQAFMDAVAVIETSKLVYVGVALVGEKKSIRKITGHLKLM